MPELLTFSGGARSYNLRLWLVVASVKINNNNNKQRCMAGQECQGREDENSRFIANFIEL